MRSASKAAAIGNPGPLTGIEVSQLALDLIREHEGCILEAYDDKTGRVVKAGERPRGTLTIGVGHTGPDVFVGQKITQAEADRLLDEDLDEAEAAVRRLVRVTLNANQFGALVSFTFNLGAGALSQSTLLRKLNAGDYDGAAEQFSRWVMAGNPKLPERGLIRRRAAEAALFLRPIDETKMRTPQSADVATVPAPPPKGKLGPIVQGVIGFFTATGAAAQIAQVGADLKAIRDNFDWLTPWLATVFEPVIRYMWWGVAGAGVASLALAIRWWVLRDRSQVASEVPKS